MSQVDDARKWKLSHPDYPLVVHNSGQWCKKAKGQMYYFGPLRKPEAALQKWLRERDYLLAGLDPPEHDKDAITIGDIAEQYLEDFDDRVASGRASRSSRSVYVSVIRLLRKSGVYSAPVKSATPLTWSAVANALEKSGRSLNTQRSIITSIRVVMNWGYKNELCGKTNYGTRLVLPSSVEIVAERGAKERFLDRELILFAIDRASLQMRTAILFGINCAFYPSDSLVVTHGNIVTTGDVTHHNFPRVKTKQPRMAVLWPETIEAVRECADRFGADGAILKNQYGREYSKHNGCGGLQDGFNRIAADLGRPAGASLGSLRHTYATVVDAIPDQSMIDLTMGHASRSLQKSVYRQSNMGELVRLQRLSDAVRAWLFYGTEVS